MYNTPVKLNIKFKVGGWYRACMTQSMGGVPAKYRLPPSAKSGRSTARDHWPCPVYTAMLITWGLYISPRRKNGARTCMTSSQGGGGQDPPPTPSSVTPRYDTPVSHVCPSIKSWLKKQAIFADHAICPTGRNLTCILYNSNLTYKSSLIIIYQRAARRPPLKSGKSHQHVACRSL